MAEFRPHVPLASADARAAAAPLPPPLLSPTPALVQPWPSERRWLRLVLLVALVVWPALIAGLSGWTGLGIVSLLLWPFVLGRGFATIARLQGSAVRVGPRQLPELHQRVQQLSARIGLRKAPDVYVLQQHGARNAFALRFFKRSFVVLYADLLDACGENTDARDFIIGHELGHHAANHLPLQGVLAPARLVPFIWKAYSRAREYTCDRYGMAVVEDRRAALRGLAILAAGGPLGSTLDLTAFVQQREDLNRPLAKLGTWFSTHPPLCERIAALEPDLASAPAPDARRARLGAAVAATLIFALPVLLLFSLRSTSLVSDAMTQFTRTGTWMRFRMSDASRPESVVAREARITQEARDKAKGMQDVASLIVAIELFKKTHARLPYDGELQEAWQESFGEAPYPTDPRWHEPYGYSADGRDYFLTASCDRCTYLSENGGKWGTWEDSERSSTPDATPVASPRTPQRRSNRRARRRGSSPVER